MECFIIIANEKIAVYSLVVERLNIELKLGKMKIKELQESQEMQQGAGASQDLKVSKEDGGGYQQDQSSHEGPNL